MHYVYRNYGEYGEVVNTPVCGTGMRGFDPHYSPHIELRELL